MIALPVSGGNAIGLVDVAFGTPWYAVIPGRAGAVTRLVAAETDNAGTDNGIHVMRPLYTPALTDGASPSGVATILAAQAAGDTTLTLNYDPSPAGNTIQSGDQVIYLASDGTYRRVTVSSWSASTLVLTVSALPAAVAAGSTMWNLGVYTDTEPGTGLPFPKLSTPTSQVYKRTLEAGFAAPAAGHPLLLYCPNATAKTKLNYAEYAW